MRRHREERCKSVAINFRSNQFEIFEGLTKIDNGNGSVVIPLFWLTRTVQREKATE